MTATEYRITVDLKRCVDCGSTTDKHVRCDDCHRLHNDASVASYGATCIHRCRNCHEVGHNRRRCTK